MFIVEYTSYYAKISEKNYDNRMHEYLSDFDIRAM